MLCLLYLFWFEWVYSEMWNLLFWKASYVFSETHLFCLTRFGRDEASYSVIPCFDVYLSGITKKLNEVVSGLFDNVSELLFMLPLFCWLIDKWLTPSDRSKFICLPETLELMHLFSISFILTSLFDPNLVSAMPRIDGIDESVHLEFLDEIILDELCWYFSENVKGWTRRFLPNGEKHL